MSKPTGNPKGHPNTRLTVAERFEMKVDRSGDCHRWVGGHRGSLGHGGGNYGCFWYHGRVVGAHVAAVLLAGMSIPDGMTVDHVKARGCEYEDCVRLDHLEVVTMRENILRSKNPAALNVGKDKCKRGHADFVPTSPGQRRGGRRCRTCDQMRRAGLIKKGAH